MASSFVEIGSLSAVITASNDVLPDACHGTGHSKATTQLRAGSRIGTTLCAATACHLESGGRVLLGKFVQNPSGRWGQPCDVSAKKTLAATFTAGLAPRLWICT